MKRTKIDAAKLQLHKEKITALTPQDLNEAKGGRNMDNTDTFTTKDIRFTQGKCDIATIGHDDGPNCLSASDWGWCWCRGI